MNKQALKKHHFWILAGLAPLLTMVAVLMITGDVGAEVEAENKKVADKLGELKGANPKGEKVLADLEQQKGVLTGKRTEMWKANWNMQAVDGRVFAWPADNDPRQRLRQLEQKNYKFGDPIEDINEGFEVFKRKEVYEAAYQQAADSILPTFFTNGRNWRLVFRHVTQWGERRPTYPQIWLALEDFWLQRAMVQPVNAINDGARLFQMATPPEEAKANKLKRSFQNRVWRVDLTVPTDGPEAFKVVRGKITNLTDRLQIMGLSNKLRLKVWLNDAPNAQPMPFLVEGDFVKAGETRDIKFVATQHTIPPGTDVQQIARVERALDEWTVPVRQVLNMEMQFLDSRNATAVLKQPEWWKPEFDPVAATAGAGAPGAPPPEAMTGEGGFGGPAATKRAKRGTPQVVLDANKLRYLDLTKQVRRIPVTIVLLIDQMFMQDALVAYSNSPLRFQITQFHWRRYRQPIAPPQETGDAFGGGGFRGDESSPPPMASVPPAGFGGGTSTFGPFGGYPGGATASVDQGQVTSGLVELTIYGVASLYEKLEVPAEVAAADGSPAPAPGPAKP